MEFISKQIKLICSMDVAYLFRLQCVNMIGKNVNPYQWVENLSLKFFEDSCDVLCLSSVFDKFQPVFICMEILAIESLLVHIGNKTYFDILRHQLKLKIATNFILFCINLFNGWWIIWSLQLQRLFMRTCRYGWLEWSSNLYHTSIFCVVDHIYYTGIVFSILVIGA